MLFVLFKSSITSPNKYGDKSLVISDLDVLKKIFVQNIFMNVDKQSFAWHTVLLRVT
jgi:hypothetical protein